VDTGFHVYIRSRIRNGGGAPEKVDAWLYEGSTQRAVLWTNYLPPDNTFATDDIALDSGDVADISDFTDLRVRITIDTLASGEDCDVSMVLLEAPDVAGATWNRSVSDTVEFSDSVTIEAQHAVSQSDEIEFSDVASLATIHVVAVADTIEFSDLVNATSFLTLRFLQADMLFRLLTISN
jgi:hypothetical protein